ncbi:MAG: hypothetical protein MHM6MM_004448 [Cercozoa sp. M6MM]
MPSDEVLLSNVDTHVRTHTELCADSVEFCEAPGYTDRFVVGCYELENGHKHGKVALWQVTPTDEEDERTELPERQDHSGDADFCRRSGLQCRSLSEIAGSAVLDLKWRPHELDLVEADHDGTLRFFRMTDDKLLKTQEVVIDESALSLSAMWTDTGDRVVTSMSNGAVVVCDVDDTVAVNTSMPLHTAECWSAAFQTGSRDVIWSGADDFALRRSDLRVGGMTWQRMFELGGVCSVAPCPEDENILAVGTFEEELHLYDTRQLRRPLHTRKYNDGVWRLRWRGRSHLLVGAMRDGFHVLRCAPDMCNTSTVSINRSHGGEALAYGCHWMSGSDEDTVLVGSCTFYERSLQVWSSSLTQPALD